MPTARTFTGISLPPYDPSRPFIPGFNDPSAAGGRVPGTLTGAPGIGGSPAAGQKPAVPDPRATQANSLAANLANLSKLRQLFNQTSQAVGIGSGMMQSETANINSLLNPPSQFVDIDRMTAEAGSGGLGGAGSPASFTRGYRMTDEEMLRRRLLGSQLMGQRANRANAILPLQNFMLRPENQQAWQNLANMVASAPDPELAFQRALELARTGISQGFGAGYGGGAPRPSIAPNFGAPAPSFAGNPSSVPTWPTLPTSVPGMMPPGTIAPVSSGEDWLSSLGLGIGQPGVTVTPTNSFLGDINYQNQDLYA